MKYPPFSISACIEIFVNNEDMPKTKIIFKIFEPMTFPKSKLTLPLLTAAKEVKSSGSDVPKATIENPIFNSLTPIIFEIFKALSTIRFVPNDNPIIDIKIIIKQINKFFVLLSI